MSQADPYQCPISTHSASPLLMATRAAPATKEQPTISTFFLPSHTYASLLELIESDASLVRHLIYKNKNQFRRQRWWSRITEISRLTAHLLQYLRGDSRRAAANVLSEYVSQVQVSSLVIQQVLTSIEFVRLTLVFLSIFARLYSAVLVIRNQALYSKMKFVPGLYRRDWAPLDAAGINAVLPPPGIKHLHETLHAAPQYDLDLAQKRPPRERTTRHRKILKSGAPPSKTLDGRELPQDEKNFTSRDKDGPSLRTSASNTDTRDQESPVDDSQGTSEDSSKHHMEENRNDRDARTVIVPSQTTSIHDEMQPRHASLLAQRHPKGKHMKRFLHALSVSRQKKHKHGRDSVLGAAWRKYGRKMPRPRMNP